MSNQRINRRTYAATLAMAAVPFIVITEISNVANNTHGSSRNTLYSIFAFLLIVCVVYFLVTCLAVVIKRLHDVGWPWVLVILCGLFWPFLLMLALVPGQRVNNIYGDKPAIKFDLRSALIWW
jgi:uncharacterized membrane protein YhaH (DUF805 family)